jgi:UDP-N-acetylmuramoylalanine--D-glutamate ligase
VDHCPLPGEHNRRNARLALQIAAAALRADGLTPDLRALATRLASFHGLPHRLALVHESDGIRWFDDSKATTPEATLLAIASFPEPAKVHLIAGGYEKKIDLSAIANLAPRLAGLYAIGATAAKVASNGGTICGTLETAVARIRSAARPGDVVLLSPGCASWDQYLNYEERGRQFAALARSR